MVEMETWVWVMTRRNIFGITVRKLREWGVQKKVKDWESIPALPFDFHLIPTEMAMFPFVFDSKLFMAGGYIESYSMRGTYMEIQPYGLSSKIYNLFVDKGLHMSEASPDCIPPPPTSLSDSFVANIAGEVYLLVYDKIKKHRVRGFWVLRSGLWHRLPDPPSLNSIGFANTCECFVHLDKLFLYVEYLYQTELSLYVFDPLTIAWTKVENNIRDSFAIWERDDYCFPDIVVSLPRVCNCHVTLSWSFQKAAGDYQVRVKITAMLVNRQDNSVFCYQSLDDCSDAIMPTSFNSFTTNVKFLDLGKGMVCVMVNGNVPQHDDGLSPVLCILVFALSLIEQELDSEATATGKEQRFLSVDGVLVNQVFAMKDYVADYKVEELLHAFIFPSNNNQLTPMDAYSSSSKVEEDPTSTILSVAGMSASLS